MRTWLCLMFLAGLARADFAAGNRAYDEGRFAEARESYLELVRRGEWSANLFYNLGNTEVRLGETGRAMLQYERALVMRPAHAEARANLKFLRERSTAKVPARTWRDVVFAGLPHGGWLALGCVSGWVGVWCLVVPWVRGRRWTAVGLCLVVVAGLGVAFAAAGAWTRARELEAAVVVVKQVEARQAPIEGAALADVLSAGSVVRWRVERGGWVQCELPDGGAGWLPVASLERVRL